MSGDKARGLADSVAMVSTTAQFVLQSDQGPVVIEAQRTNSNAMLWEAIVQEDLQFISIVADLRKGLRCDNRTSNDFVPAMPVIQCADEEEDAFTSHKASNYCSIQFRDGRPKGWTC